MWDWELQIVLERLPRMPPWTWCFSGYNNWLLFWQGGDWCPELLIECVWSAWFGMLSGNGLRDRQFSTLVFYGSPACNLSTSELKNCLSQRPCLMPLGPVGRSVNPTFHSQMSTPDHPLHQITWFRCNDILIFNLIYWKWIGVKRLSSWWDVHFGAFPLKIQQMGAKMGQILTPSKLGFEHPIWMRNIKEVY